MQIPDHEQVDGNTYPTIAALFSTNAYDIFLNRLPVSKLSFHLPVMTELASNSCPSDLSLQPTIINAYLRATDRDGYSFISVNDTMLDTPRTLFHPSDSSFKEEVTLSQL